MENENTGFVEFNLSTSDILEKEKYLDIGGVPRHLCLVAKNENSIRTKEGLEQALENGEIHFDFLNGNDDRNAIFDSEINNSDDTAKQNLATFEQLLKDIDEKVKEVLKTEYEKLNGDATQISRAFSDKVYEPLIFPIKLLLQSGNLGIYGSSGAVGNPQISNQISDIFELRGCPSHTDLIRF